MKNQLINNICEECGTWARSSGVIMTKHHPECSKYNLEKDLVNLIKRLLKGIECWASDEDGVHPDCWETYKEAKIRLGEPVLEPVSYDQIIAGNNDIFHVPAESEKEEIKLDHIPE